MNNIESVGLTTYVILFSELSPLHGKRRLSHVSILSNPTLVCLAVVQQLKDKQILPHSVLQECSSGKSFEECPDVEVVVVSLDYTVHEGAFCPFFVWWGCTKSILGLNQCFSKFRVPKS